MRFFSNPRSRLGVPKPLASTFILLSLIPAILAVSSGAPTDADDLICTTTGNIQDCYPRVFNATKIFQVVREGQLIPPGLHVRMDFETGHKEAKLMDPAEADGNQIVMNQGSSLVVVETQSKPSMEIDDGPMVGTYLAGTDVVEKALPQSNDFFEALSAIAAGNATAEHDLDAALEALADVSNDVYYGELMTTDYDMIAALLCFSFDKPSAGISPSGYPRSHAAMNTLAGALQNNPKVLQEVMDKWPQLEQHTCAPNRTALGQHIFHGSIAPTTLSADAKIAAQQGQRVRALASIYGGLLPSPSFRREFLTTGGMRHFLEVLIRTEPELAKAQTRLTQIVMDIFLDEDMGAKRGQWPSIAALKGNEAKRVCGGEGDGRTKEGCWDWHVERIAKGAKEGHWSWVLAEALRKERGRGPVKEEL